MYSIGIDIGYSAVKTVILNQNLEIVFHRYCLHERKPLKVLSAILDSIYSKIDTEKIKFGAMSGNCPVEFRKLSGLTKTNSITSLLEGAKASKLSPNSIIEIGGESSKFITGICMENLHKMEISLNSSCAAGTGAFIEEQASRIGIPLEKFSEYVSKADSIPRIAGRCSVFAKTDIIHHQQEGISSENILLGLSYALARNYKSAVIKELPVGKPLMFCGGVAYNSGIILALKDILKLQEVDIFIPEYPGEINAIGSASIAFQKSFKVNFDNLYSICYQIDNENKSLPKDSLKPLYKFAGNIPDNSRNNSLLPAANSKCYLGIDSGSTSTNLVLIDENNNVITHQYLKTTGKPVDRIIEGLQKISDNIGINIRIAGAGTTGSGRYLSAELIGADIIKDEITSQTRAAVFFDPEVDTIFEIGGQDSKYISLRNGAIVDFHMNKICAAGTGAFIEEQANKFGISIDSFGLEALKSENPFELGERCTVFMESSVASALARGVKTRDIISGLCYSIARNYLDKIVGQKRIGNKIFFQGGVAHNQGIISALRALTGKEIIIPPFFSVTGALGAALLAKDNVHKYTTQFKGFHINAENFKKETIKIPSLNITANRFSAEINDFIFQNNFCSPMETQKIIGIPRALFAYGMYPLFNAFFSELGFKTILSDATNERIISLGQEYSMDDTCLPLKLIAGHVADLVSKKPDFIFFPQIFTVKQPEPAIRQNFACIYMQLAPEIIKQTINLSEYGIKFISPTMGFGSGKEFMIRCLTKTGELLGCSQENIGKAIIRGMEAALNFEKSMRIRKTNDINNLDPDKKYFVIISKIYGIADPVLNLGIPDRLVKMGYPVIPFYSIPDTDISENHPNMFWSFGKHILQSALFIKEHPNVYAILLTHHGCGPDSALIHYFEEIMEGKPYLNVEVDEHSSRVGVITRVEAFVNSLNNSVTEKTSFQKSINRKMISKNTGIHTAIDGLDSETTFFLPHIYPYSNILSLLLNARGIRSEILQPFTKESYIIGKKHTSSQGSLSFSSHIGSFIQKAENIRKNISTKTAFVIPQNEGSELDGQYARLTRTILDRYGFHDIRIFSPFREDFPDLNISNEIFLSLLTGDIIMNAPYFMRSELLNNINKLIINNSYTESELLLLSAKIKIAIEETAVDKSILVIGEYPVLFSDFLNKGILKNLELMNIRILYQPMSEMLLSFWKHYAELNPEKISANYQKNISGFEELFKKIIVNSENIFSFDNSISKINKAADKTIPYFSGAFGRYRLGKALTAGSRTDGVMAVSSMYENTGVATGIIIKKILREKGIPYINLTFDGNVNETDSIKTDTFIYYLKNRKSTSA